MYPLITITGPTASGKTSFATALANQLGGEIISADSRQVYKGMDIGTGKDISEYTIDGQTIPYHLIDICEAGEKYNLFEFQQDFHKVYNDILQREKIPILCGGTGLYIEAVLKGYKLAAVPENKTLRERLSSHSLEELTTILASYKRLHNTTDVDTAKRAIRAIEIEEYMKAHEAEIITAPPINSLIIGLNIDRELRRKKISSRLQARLDEGMIEEIAGIIDSGVAPEDLIYYGLEYKYVTLYLIGELTFNEMVRQLEIAIHQFAKRQMTWFRGMERRGFTIHWIEAWLPLEEKLDQAFRLIHQRKAHQKQPFLHT